MSSIAGTCLLPGSCFVTTCVTFVLVVWNFCFLSCKHCHHPPPSRFWFCDHWCNSSPSCFKAQFLFLWALPYVACVFPGSCFVTTGVTCFLAMWNFSFVSSIAVTCLLPGSCFVTTGATPPLCAWKSSFLSCKHWCMQPVFFQVLALRLLVWLVSLMLESLVPVRHCCVLLVSLQVLALWLLVSLVSLWLDISVSCLVSVAVTCCLPLFCV